MPYAFEKSVPLPSRQTRWDFTTAEDGDSLPFPDLIEAKKFAAAARAYARRNRLLWRTTTAPDLFKPGFRVWLLIPKATPATPTRHAYDPPVPSIYANADSDEFGIVVDLRRGEDVRLERTPEARPVEVEPEAVDGKPKRRNKRSAA